MFKYKISPVEMRLMCDLFFSDYWAIEKAMTRVIFYEEDTPVLPVYSVGYIRIF